MSGRRRIRAFAPCRDCGQMTIWRDRPGENYMVSDEVWAAAGMDASHIPDDDAPDSEHYYLCIGCLEARLGRELAAGDFTDVPLNRRTGTQTPRLRDRLQRSSN